ncbi:nitroreductase family deazaflavin-dependent oxidoreductase [Nocardia wallacei]|uniref:nitroreductase family deazaflavin-dependent oxidoreductase n=1 Tax=Nocardia wallacei TaxID=480035 RepID=UPI0024561344|nr:nitroreductase family deazaflavin-dependent oxidoreductase [Nocardia wallacei]
MSATDNSLPTYFPRWLGRLGAQYMNPVMRRVAPSLPGYAVIEHVGRKSGRRYETPVNIFRKGGAVAVVLVHGETQWARNVVAAGQASLRCRGGTVTVRNPRFVGPGAATADMPDIARLCNRRIGLFVVDVA